MQSIEDKLRNFIGKEILCSSDRFPYSDETSFLDNGIIDSACIVELIIFIEKEFHIVVKDSEVVPGNFDSISRLSKYIKDKAHII